MAAVMRRVANSRTAPLLGVLLITLLGFALRAYRLGFKSLWYDEAVLYWISRGGIREIVAQNASLNSAPPLFPILISLISGLGISEWVLRFLPFLAGGLSVPAMYALGRRFLSPWGGLCAALLLAVAASNIEASQDVREYSFGVLLSILLILQIDIFLETRSWRNAMALAALSTVGILLQYGLVLLILALDAIVVVRMALPSKGGRDDWLKWGAVQVAVITASVGVYFLSLRAQWQPGGFGAGGHLAGAYWDPTVESVLGFLARQTKDIIDLAFPGSLFLLVFYIGAAVLAVDRTRWRFALYAGVPFVGAAAAGVASIYPYHGGRQVLFLTPLLYLVAASGIDHLLRVDPKKVVPAVLLLLLARKASQDLPAYFQSPGREATGSVVKRLQSVVGPGDPVFVCKEDPAFRYYFHERFPIHDSPLIVANQDPVSGPTDNENTLDDVLTDAGRVWLVILRCDDMERLLGHVADSWTMELVAEATPDAWLYYARR
jgi:hypothetical protein